MLRARPEISESGGGDYDWLGFLPQGGFSYSVVMVNTAPIRERFAALAPHLDERARRMFAATEAQTAGYGGIAAVSRATGIAASTIGRGLKDLAAPDTLDPDRVRRPGGGSKKLVDQDVTLLSELLA